MSRIQATIAGRAVARSGLLPDTAQFFLAYLLKCHPKLATLVSAESIDGIASREDALSFAMVHACLCSPEFVSNGEQPNTRNIPYQLANEFIVNERATQYSDFLAEPYWYDKHRTANGAMVACEWISGANPSFLEELSNNVRYGSLREMFHNVAWVISGVADILSDITQENLPARSLIPEFKDNPSLRRSLRRFPRLLRKLVWQLEEGLPEDVLWMTLAVSGDHRIRVSRTEFLNLRLHDIVTPQSAMDGGRDEDRLVCFRGNTQVRQQKSNWFKERCRHWHANQRQFVAERHYARTAKCQKSDLVRAYYNSYGTAFESVFEEILTHLRIDFEKLDVPGKAGAPDYVLKFENRGEIIVELKTKQTTPGLIGMNEATDVLRASELHGHRDAFCVTLCHPGVDPSVSSKIIPCGRLCVVESADLAEALVRVCERMLSHGQLYDWLTQPGQALMSDLPFKTTGFEDDQG